MINQDNIPSGMRRGIFTASISTRLDQCDPERRANRAREVEARDKSNTARDAVRKNIVDLYEKNKLLWKGEDLVEEILKKILQTELEGTGWDNEQLRNQIRDIIEKPNLRDTYLKNAQMRTTKRRWWV